MSGKQSRAVPLELVPRIGLSRESWSAIIVNDKTVEDNHASLGYSVFRPGFVSDDLSHEVDELCFIVSGRGIIRLEDGHVEVKRHDGLFIPARAWHTIVNESDEELTMVFAFPSPDYPPTERRAAR